MPVLSDAERFDVWAKSMRNALGDLGTITKQDLRAAIDATDNWIDLNQVAYNATIPLPARGQLSTQQKVLIFCWVAMKRAGLM